ncbi:MAG TPA: glutathione peroxidase [Steroidobacteraceae bacterium]|nr:glutathione peroxidase [Steroidobacteraceae bacterium]
MSDFYSFNLNGIDGSKDLLGKLRGRVTLAVNVASRCGLTPQYTGLERLQQELADEDFTVVGFPCNQFGAQEPGTEEQIRSFCSTTYGVTFPMSSKIEVNGPQRHPLYAWLTSADNGFPGDIEWNFEKFLISRDGRLLKRYPPPTKPEDKGLLQDIADALEDELEDDVEE